MALGQLLYGENFVISGYEDKISGWFLGRYVPCYRRERETNGDDEKYQYGKLIYLLGFLPFPVHILMPTAGPLVGVRYVSCRHFFWYLVTFFVKPIRTAGPAPRLRPLDSCSKSARESLRYRMLLFIYLKTKRPYTADLSCRE